MTTARSEIETIMTRKLGSTSSTRLADHDSGGGERRLATRKLKLQNKLASMASSGESVQTIEEYKHNAETNPAFGYFTQDEIDDGFATRRIGGKIRDIPVNLTDLILDKQGNTVIGKPITQVSRPTPDLLLPKGSTSKVSNQIGKLVFTRPPAEQRNALDAANFKIAEVFDIPFDSQDSRYVFLANRGGYDGKTFEIIEGKTEETKTKTIKFEKPESNKEIKLVSPDNIDELIQYLHNEAKVI